MTRETWPLNHLSNENCGAAHDSEICFINSWLANPVKRMRPISFDISRLRITYETSKIVYCLPLARL